MSDESEQELILSTAGVRKRFGEVTAVDGIDLEIGRRRVLALLGPSGCGKTTMLRLIAGLERPDAGTIVVEDEVLNGPGVEVAPERRRISMVFQDYALFPHLDVARNVGYALGQRPDPGRVQQMLALVGLSDEAGSPVHELSGGQQQRVALARALASTPRLVLLDEPFSNLDAGLRLHLRNEVRDILRRAGATALFVTHDQEEAMSLADTVAVMRAGRIEQVGSPEEVYGRPATRWVAEFLGDAEVLEGEASKGTVRCELGSLPADPQFNGPAQVIVRPESIALTSGPAPGGATAHRAVVTDRDFYGHDQMVHLELESGRRLRCRRPGYPAWHPGDHVRIWIEGPVTVLPADRASAPQ